MSTANQSSFQRVVAALATLCCAVLAFTTPPVATTQSRILPPQRSANSNTSPKRQRVATLRASDSAEGSRVALTADQSLNDYEAYRRGDRFYVRIPPTEVPRPEAVRGRAFGDVKVQRGANDTVVSFRLQPGATARVEQRGNKLDVVFTMPGARTGASTSSNRDVARRDAGPAPPPPDSRRRGNTNSNPSSSSLDRSNRNSGERVTSASAPTPRGGASPKSSPTPSPKPSPTSAASPKSSPVAAQKSSSSPTATVSSSQPTAQGTTWNNLKQRARYWILLAQLNPVPVGIGVAVLLLLIGLVVMQRRRAKTTRRVRSRTATRKTEVTAQIERSATAATIETVEPVEDSAELAGITAVAAESATEPPAAKPAAPADAQHERVTRASEEVKKLMTGGDYDESIIASEDRYTRQLVGAELLSALVGRNLQRRERARAAFMNHGYFDDATRDLRIAESPNERAAAARRLSFVHDREATPHLIAALEDASPDVRRASVEALMDLRDPAAIAPLNSLMQTETDRRVPRSLIKQAIEGCATSGSSEPAATPAISSLPYSAPARASQPESEREVIEI